MKSFLAVLAMVVFLMAGMAGMAPATTLTFDAGDPSVSPAQSPENPYIIPAGSPIASVTFVNWHDDGGGHLYCNNSVFDNVIYFTNPTYVNSFQITALPYPSFDPSASAPYPDDPNFVLFGPVTMSAFSHDNPVPVWSTTVDFGAEANYDYTTPYNYLTVDVNAPDVTKIIFYGSNPLFNEEGPAVYPSIDNLVINEAAAVPIPASVWLLFSGLLGLVGLRRKLTC